MPQGHPVIIMPRAERDIDSIFSWLAERSPLGTRKRLQAIDQALERMATETDSFSAALEAEALNEKLKQCLFKTSKGRTYRAVFLIEKQTVFILRVRGPGQPPLMSDEVDLGSQ